MIMMMVCSFPCDDEEMMIILRVEQTNEFYSSDFGESRGGYMEDKETRKK